MIQRGRNPYECFKDDRWRLLALFSRDMRYVLIAGIAVLTGENTTIQTIVGGWLA